MPDNEIYLNHAGTSWPKPQVVIDAVQRAMTLPAGDWREYSEQAHRDIAAFFGIHNPEQLLLTPGCTSSLSVGVADIDLEGSQRVLTSAWEHHALHRPLLMLRDSGITVDYVRATADSALDLDHLEHELSRGDVGLVAITASANVTGDLLPFEAVIEIAHQYGAQVLLDAAQVVGWLDLDLVALGADVVAFGGHKGLQGPWGIGGLYIAEGARMKRATTTRTPSASSHPARPGYCDVGSVDQAALAGLHAGVGWLEQIDRPTALRLARAQIGEMEVALKHAGARCLGIFAAPDRMPTVAFSVNEQSSTELAAALKAFGLVVGSGLQCAPLAHSTAGTEETGLVRISVGIGQETSEVRSAIKMISERRWT